MLTSSPIASVSSTAGSLSTATIIPYVTVKDSTSTGFGIVVNNNIVRYTGASTLTANIGTANPTTNYTYNNATALTLGGATTVNSLLLGASTTTLDLGASTFTLASGGLLNLGTTTIQSAGGAGTLTAGSGNELIASAFGDLTHLEFRDRQQQRRLHHGRQQFRGRPAAKSATRRSSTSTPWPGQPSLGRSPASAP